MARLAMGVVGWTPETFWAATPAELRLAVEGRFPPPPAAPVNRADLMRLMQHFPD